MSTKEACLTGTHRSWSLKCKRGPAMWAAKHGVCRAVTEMQGKGENREGCDEWRKGEVSPAMQVRAWKPWEVMAGKWSTWLMCQDFTLAVVWRENSSTEWRVEAIDLVDLYMAYIQIEIEKSGWARHELWESLWLPLIYLVWVKRERVQEAFEISGFGDKIDNDTTMPGRGDLGELGHGGVRSVVGKRSSIPCNCLE